MAKLLKEARIFEWHISKCAVCPHCVAGCCTHEDAPRVADIQNLHVIPRWCPLPDAKEDANDRT